MAITWEVSVKAIKHYFTGFRRMAWILATLVVLIVWDGLISQFLVTSGLAREGNPFLVNLVGGGHFLLIKVAGALLCALLLWDIHRHRPRMAVISSICFVVFYTGIVLWNLSVLVTTGV